MKKILYSILLLTSAAPASAAVTQDVRVTVTGNMPLNSTIKELFEICKNCVDMDDTLESTVRKNFETIKKFISQCNKDGDTILHALCRAGYSEILHWILDKEPSFINLKNQKEQTLLHVACIEGFTDMINILIKKDKQLIYALDGAGNKAIHSLVEQEHYDQETTKLLLQYFKPNNDLFKKDILKLFSISALKNNKDLVKLLLKNYGMNFNAEDLAPIFETACKKGHSDVAIQLVKSYSQLFRNLKIEKLFSYKETMILHLLKECKELYSNWSQIIPMLQLACEKELEQVIDYLVKNTSDIKNYAVGTSYTRNRKGDWSTIETTSQIVTTVTEPKEKSNILNLITLSLRIKNKNLIKILLNNFGHAFTTEEILPLFYNACKTKNAKFAIIIIKYYESISKILKLAPLFELQEVDIINVLKESKQPLDTNLLVPALHLTCKKGYTELLKYLVEKYPSLKENNILDGLSPLDTACINGKLEIVKALSKINLDLINYKNSAGFNALHHAAYNGHIDIFVHLASKSLNFINLTTNDGHTVFHLACMGSSTDMAKYIWDNYKHLATQYSHLGLTPFHHACSTGNLKMVRFLLQIDPNLINIETKESFTPLHIACNTGNLEMVEFLLNQSYAPGLIKKGTIIGETPLHMACKNGYIDIVKTLVKKDKNLLYLADNEGKQAINYAIMSKNLVLCELLLVLYISKKDVNIIISSDERRELQELRNCISPDIIPYLTDKNGKNIVHYSVENNFKLFLQSIMNVDIDYELVNDMDNSNFNPIHYAVRIKNIEIFESLIQCASSKFAKKQINLGSLFKYACEMGNGFIVEYLLSILPGLAQMFQPNAININFDILNNNLSTLESYIAKNPNFLYLKDFEGSTIFHYACSMGNIDMIQYILKLNPQFNNAVNNLGLTGYSFALNKNQYEALNFLSSYMNQNQQLNQQTQYGQIPAYQPQQFAQPFMQPQSFVNPEPVYRPQELISTQYSQPVQPQPSFSQSSETLSTPSTSPESVTSQHVPYQSSPEQTFQFDSPFEQF